MRRVHARASGEAARRAKRGRSLVPLPSRAIGHARGHLRVSRFARRTTEKRETARSLCLQRSVFDIPKIKREWSSQNMLKYSGTSMCDNHNVPKLQSNIVWIAQEPPFLVSDIDHLGGWRFYNLPLFLTYCWQMPYGEWSLCPQYVFCFA